MNRGGRDALISLAWTVLFVSVMVGLFCLGDLIFYGRVR